MKYRQLLHVESGQTLLSSVRWCDTFTSKLRGFTFRRTLAEDEGLVLVEKGESRMNTAIHMLFVFFDLGVVWVNEAGVVVDRITAKRWRSSYVPKFPARYVIEVHPNMLSQIELGDHIQFPECET